MRRAGSWAIGAWALLMSGVGALSWSGIARVVRPIFADSRSTTPPPIPSPSRYPAESLVTVVSARDVFRTDRRPAAVAYAPMRGSSPLPDGPPKAALTLTGVVWGEVPEAVIEGMPTTTGPRVVRVGDVVGGLTVRRIERGRVVVAGMDTTWALTVREPWR